MSAIDKPHLVCIPFPAQSHIGAMMKLAKLLHHKGFYITFVNSEHNHYRILRSKGPHSLDGLPDFQFATVPDGLPPSDANATQNLQALKESLQKNGVALFLNFLDELKGKSGIPPVTSIISDGFLTFTVAAAQQFGTHVVLFWTVSASAFMTFYQFPVLLQKGLVPLKDESFLSNGYLDTVIDWIPGMKDICLKDLPSYIRTTDANDMSFNFCMEAAERSNKASGNIIHTFNALEKDVLESLSLMLPCLNAIGPLPLLLSHILEQDEEKDGRSMPAGLNFWKEESECLEWLDSKKPGSVMYVNFGSLAQITTEQLVEISWGLANSKYDFLWIIRPDLVVGNSTGLLAGIEEEIKERGLIASWCPQEQVLNHPSVGGFLTHCGWNSILESLTAGVPMICWPFLADQQPNCKFICSEWMVGMKMDDDDVTRVKVESLVRELMGGEDGVKLKNKAKEWKKLAEEATSGPDASSSLAFDNLVNKLKCLSLG